jgi:hypothetical protein
LNSYTYAAVEAVPDAVGAGVESPVPVSVFLFFHLSARERDVQLHAESSGENGTEEGDVTPDDGAAVGCQ